MKVDLLFYAAICAGIIVYVLGRDFISDQRREARHRDGRDRFNRAVQNAERLGFIEVSSNYEDARGITDISMRREHPELDYLTFYMQQSGGTIRASLKLRPNGNFVDHSIKAESYSEFAEKVEQLDNDQRQPKRQWVAAPKLKLP